MTMPRFLTVLFSLTLMDSQPAMSSDTDRLNVLFIAADDLRNDLSVYGHPLAKTPNFDRLAARGVTFNRAYCQQALCNPSRASLMTGRRPDTLALWNLTKHFRNAFPDIVTLPQHFKQNGYFTQNIGKIYHNWRTETEGDPPSWSVPAQLHFNTHYADRPQVDGELPHNFAIFPRTENRWRTEILDVPDEAYFDGRISKLGIEALQQRAESDQPFFLAVGFWKPHLPFNPPKKYWDLYDPVHFAPAKNDQPPENCPPIALHNGRELLSEGTGRIELTREGTIELLRGYMAGISFLDAQVGKLLDELDRQKLTDNTIIVFWSDHGFHLGEHSLWCKTSNFELDARVPLIIAPPNCQTAGQTTDSFAELLDLYPTLSDLCDLPKPDGVEGTSLVPVLRDPTESVKPAAWTQHPRPAYYKDKPDVMGVSVRTDRYRYTEWRDFASGNVVASELYDHKTDPDENHNVVAAPPDKPAFEAARKLLHQTFPKQQ
ncbi:sulfatase-like hydrolase/transferase [bacterium]|nr:sulfatase-like hydrolase/transferase [bacterium]